MQCEIIKNFIVLCSCYSHKIMHHVTINTDPITSRTVQLVSAADILLLKILHLSKQSMPLALV